MSKWPFFSQLLPFGQGMYYLITGVWPIVSPNSFQKITGPKIDVWLVKITGGLISVIGAALIMAGLRQKRTPEVALLAVGTSAILATGGLVYSTRGRISPVYALEAAVEISLAGLWLLSLRKRN